MKRKFLVVLLSLAMLLTFMPMAAYADDGDTQYPYWDDTHTHLIIDENGNVAKGITYAEADDNYYYFDEINGTLYTGFFYVNIDEDLTNYYYADEDGVLYSGWKTIGDDEYYFQPYDNSDPFAAYTGDIYEIDGDAYYFDDEGAMYKGLFTRPYWATDDDGEEYVAYDHFYADEETGILQTGWQEVDGDTYYFHEDNYFAYADGSWTIDDYYCTFDENGVLISKESLDDPGDEPYTEGETLWLGCEYEHTPQIYNVMSVDDVEVLDVWAEDPDILRIELDGDGDGTYIYDYTLYPEGLGTTEVYIEYSLDGEINTISGTYTIKPFPEFLTSLTIDDIAQDADTYTNKNFYEINDYEGTELSIEFTTANDWYLYDADGDNDAGGFLVDPDVEEYAWTVEFPEDFEFTILKFYFKNDLDEEIDYYVQVYRSDEDDPYYPPEPSGEGQWDETHTHYIYENGSYAKGHVWIWDDQADQDHAYYFDEETGELQHGWIEAEESWTDDETGETQKWIERYYADPTTGILATGWKQMGGKWYYFNDYGNSYFDGVRNVDGKLYYFDETGIMKTGWIEENGSWTDPDDGEVYTWTNWYYADSKGVLASGWNKIGSFWYYFSPYTITDEYGWDGYLPTLHMNGSEVIDGKPYFLNPANGRMGSGGWIEDKHTYEYEDGYVETWTNWYYADSSGVLATGWKQIKSKWYYFRPINKDDEYSYNVGMMYTGNHLINGKSYLFSKDGIMQSGGWVKDYYEFTDYLGNKRSYTDWYYADSNGVLAEGWKKLSGKWYYFSKSSKEEGYAGGYMYNNDVYRIDNKLYAFNKDGVMATGWVKFEWDYYTENDKLAKRTVWAYANTSGIVQTGWKKISGSWYYLDKDWGYMATNTFASDSGGMMYLGSDGKAVYNKWVKYDGDWYFIKSSGYMAKNTWMKDSKGWCYVGADGVMVANGWAKDSKGYCWMDSTGHMLEKTQWVKYDGGWYYIEKGYMARSKWAKDSKGWCYLGDDGLMVTNGFVPDKLGQCWIGPDGYMVEETGLVEYDGDTYGIKDGYMVKSGSIEVGGVTYNFDENGILIP